MYFFQKKEDGFSIIELLVGASILSVVMVSLVVVFQAFLVQSFESLERTQAAFLAEEGIEAVKILRDKGWDENIGTLSDGSDYYLVFENNLWVATTVPQDLIDGMFERTFVIESVDRDGNDDITTSGTDDPNTKHIQIEVAWFAGSATTTKSLETYVTNFHE